MTGNDHLKPDVDTLAAVIARSPIVVAHWAWRALSLPEGFDEIDVAILDWIAAEGRRIGRVPVHLPH